MGTREHGDVGKGMAGDEIETTGCGKVLKGLEYHASEVELTLEA